MCIHMVYVRVVQVKKFSVQKNPLIDFAAQVFELKKSAD